jgi:hypothetical protein
MAMGGGTMSARRGYDAPVGPIATCRRGPARDRSVRRRLVALVMLLALGWPAASSAHHVGIEASVGAILKERAGSGSWRVAVSWSAACAGAGASGAFYSGNLNLDDQATGERIYLGGVAGASGTAVQIVASKPSWRALRPELTISCGDEATLHGAGPITVIGPAVLIPPLGRAGGGGGGGGGGGDGGGGSGGGDPTSPQRAGGCLRALVGTDAPDTLAGGDAGDVVFGRGGGDAIRGRGGHDCLIGGTGGDALRGEGGHDRLTGGRGADTLIGGAGLNAYDAGPGDDSVNAVNGRAELVRCGPGRDRARVDRRDRVSGCERLTGRGR